jgi:hypothetical protein
VRRGSYKSAERHLEIKTIKKIFELWRFTYIFARNSHLIETNRLQFYFSNWKKILLAIGFYNIRSLKSCFQCWKMCLEECKKNGKELSRHTNARLFLISLSDDDYLTSKPFI